MSFYVIDLRSEGNIVVTLVTSTLPLETTNVLLDVTLHLLELVHSLLLGALDLASDFVVQLLIFYAHIVFDLANLNFDDLCSFLNLEVSDLRAQWLKLFTNLFNKLATVCTFKLNWTRLHHGRSTAALALGTRTDGASRAVDWTHRPIRHHHHLLPVGGGDDLVCAALTFSATVLPELVARAALEARVSTAMRWLGVKASGTERVGHRLRQDVFDEAVLTDVLDARDEELTLLLGVYTAANLCDVALEGV